MLRQTHRTVAPVSHLSRADLPCPDLCLHRALQRDEALAVADRVSGGLVKPPGVQFGKTLAQRPSPEWRNLGGGVRSWEAAD